MSRCERCGKPLDTVRSLCHYVPQRKIGIRIVGKGYYVSEFRHPVCLECSRNCGSLRVEGGCAFCPDCGAKVVRG